MNETLLICGLGRCGTSLVMQMLDMGGFPVVGKYPAYEPQQASSLVITQNYIDEHRGKAIKLLDPMRASFVPQNVRVIYLMRNLKEQARSQLKTAKFFAGLPGGGRRDAGTRAEI